MAHSSNSVRRRRSPKIGPEAVLRRVVELGRAAGQVDSIGVALPGLFDTAGAAVLLPNLHGDWAGVSIRDPLE